MKKSKSLEKYIKGSKLNIDKYMCYLFYFQKKMYVHYTKGKNV